jgi:competence protein ComEA
MIKKILAAMLALFAAMAFAAVDVNKATQAELDSVKGIGPAIATKIVDERQKGSFKDWQDLIDRVKGVGQINAAKFSTEGLTVNGAAFSGAPAKAAAPAAKKEDKPAATPAVTADEKPTVPSADDKKAAAKKAAEDKKAAKAAAAEDAKKAKADKAAAKKAAQEAKAASAAK